MVFKKLKDLVIAHRERRKTSEFGKRMPDERTTVRILDALMKTVKYPEKDLFRMHGHNPWEALMTNFGKVNFEMHLLRKPVVSRIATKYALDAAGLSVRFDAEKRAAVHKVMAGVVDKTENMVRAIGAENVGVESQILLINKAFKELSGILGEKKARAFVEAYTEKVSRLYTLARHLPVMLK